MALTRVFALSSVMSAAGDRCIIGGDGFAAFTGWAVHAAAAAAAVAAAVISLMHILIPGV